MDEVLISGESATARTPEGASATVPLAALRGGLGSNPDPLADFVFPDGVKHAWWDPSLLVILQEIQPAVRPVRWIDKRRSPVPFGAGTLYQEFSLAFPYIIMLAVFAHHPRTASATGLGFRLAQRTELFVRNAPISSLDDELYFGPFLNVTRHTPDAPPDGIEAKGKCLSWFCTQTLNLKHFDAERDSNRRIRKSMAALVEHFFSGFNLSSDSGTWPGELRSWHSEYVIRKVDPRIATPERWQKATEQDPSFIINDVGFIPLPSGFTIRRVVQRLFEQFAAKGSAVKTSADLARMIFNHGQPTQFAYPHKLWGTEPS